MDRRQFVKVAASAAAISPLAQPDWGKALAKREGRARYLDLARRWDGSFGYL